MCAAIRELQSCFHLKTKSSLDVVYTAYAGHESNLLVLLVDILKE